MLSYSRSDEADGAPGRTRSRSGSRGNIPLGHNQLAENGAAVSQSGIHGWRYSMVCARAAGHLQLCMSDIFPRRVLFFPFGNNCDCASFYLEHGFTDKPPEKWYKCVQFGLVMWNPNAPTSFVTHRRHLHMGQTLLAGAFLTNICRGTPPVHRRGRGLGLHEIRRAEGAYGNQREEATAIG